MKIFSLNIIGNLFPLFRQFPVGLEVLSLSSTRAAAIMYGSQRDLSKHLLGIGNFWKDILIPYFFYYFLEENFTKSYI